MMHEELLIRKLQQIQALASECLQEFQGKTKMVRQPSTKRLEKPMRNLADESAIVDIVNKLRDCDKSEIIEKRILDEKSVDNRILLPLYICAKHFPQRRLTTGEIAKITSELGVKIKQPNVAKCVAKSLLKYLDSNSTRVKGKPCLYRLNRKGIAYFESIIKD
jgi:hypothetical protein